jgi:hypothetical protein
MSYSRFLEYLEMGRVKKVGAGLLNTLCSLCPVRLFGRLPACKLAVIPLFACLAF